MQIYGCNMGITERAVVTGGDAYALEMALSLLISQGWSLIQTGLNIDLDSSKLERYFVVERPRPAPGTSPPAPASPPPSSPSGPPLIG